MTIELTLEEERVIGCLMEKSVTTPDQHPLTLNALTNACNQKSSRNPVMNLEPGEVQRIARDLHDKHLIRIEEGFKNNTEKYTQRLCNSTINKYQFDSAEYAIICLLLLRGPQTPGELRSRSGRLHTFDNVQHVVESIEKLMHYSGGALIARLPRQAGRQDHEYTHLFAGEKESVVEEISTLQRVPSSSSSQQLTALEARIERLEKALGSLAERLGEDIDLS